MPNKKTTEQFIQEAKEIHGEKYDYSLVDYKGTHTKVLVVCPEHGKFLSRPNDHIKKGAGCPSCVGLARGCTEQFIKQAMQVHGTKYDYSHVKYVNVHTKVTVMCPKHGPFEITPKSHISQKSGCVPCSYEQRGSVRRKTTEQFIKEAQKIHGDNYDYSLVQYQRNNKKVKIVCKKHGVFNQDFVHHVGAKQGCPHCWKERRPPGVGGYHEGFFEKNPDQKETPAILYVIKMTHETGSFIKVGITKNSIKQRYSRTGNGSKYLKKEVLYIIPLTLYRAWNVEHEILEKLKEYQYFPNFEFEGKTECLKNNEIVLSTLDHLMENP